MLISVAPTRSTAHLFQIGYAYELLVWPCVGLTKIGVLLLYKRIFAIHAFQILCWCSIGLVAAWTVAIELATLRMRIAAPIDDHAESFSCLSASRFFVESNTETYLH